MHSAVPSILWISAFCCMICGSALLVCLIVELLSAVWIIPAMLCMLVAFALAVLADKLS